MLCEEDENGPESLLDQCLLYIVRHLSTICFINSNYYELHPGHILPRELCEKLMKFYYQNVGEIDDKFVNLFRNSDVTNLKRVRLRNSNISDEGLEVLLKHNLVELDLEKCKRISNKSLSVLNGHGINLQNLSIGTAVDLLPTQVSFDINNQNLQPVINTPNLKKIAIRNFQGQKEILYHAILKPLVNLVHLDLSGCVEIEDLSFLVCLRNLAFLVLFNVKKVQEGMPYICALKSLRHLDVSQSNDKIRRFSSENQTLALIIKSLPNLVSLDISGTNLAGTGVAEMSNKDGDGRISDIPGLSARMSNKLEFLGLYGTQHAACRRHDIPAIKIAGDANEEQIIVGANAYIDRPEILQRVLNDLYHLFRYEHVYNTKAALEVVLSAMDRHISEKHIQISGSATLFYIVKNKDIPPFSASTKRSVIRALLNGMNAHKDDDTMMRNGCLTLCQFKIPQDVLFEYERLVLTLLHIVSDMEQEGFVQRIGIYLLNSLACQVDNQQKQLLGDLGAIQKMLWLIDERVKRGVCDDVLEVAWSTMWNVTDETAINCERFLDGLGINYFLQCLEMFHEKDELMRNMMGLLGNVAEVKHLRKRLMVRKYIETFQDLVNSNRDGIEVSYNAVGVLSHLASDGPDAWEPSCPDRSAVLKTMRDAIKQWSLLTERNINYRSFEPILQLARVRHTPECQHWAVWALANLTGVYPDKYCSLVEAEGGIEILKEIVEDDAPYEDIKLLAHQVLENCNKFFKQPESLQQFQLDG